MEPFIISPRDFIIYPIKEFNPYTNEYNMENKKH